MRFVVAFLVLAALQTTFPMAKAAAAPGWHSQWVEQSAYPSMSPGQMLTFWINFRNVGTETWNCGVWGRQVNLALNGDNKEPFRLGMAVNWLWDDRIATTVLCDTKPQEIAQFRFNVRAPASPGAYVLNLRPVVDGNTWLEDEGVFWTIGVMGSSSPVKPTLAPTPVVPRATATPTPAPTARPPTLAPATPRPLTLPALPNPFAGYPNVNRRNSVSKSIDRGRYLLLTDRSLWEVSRFDRFTSRFWYFDDVIVTSDRFGFAPWQYKITEVSAFGGSSDSVGARYLATTPLFLSARSRDGSIVRLSDSSVWEIDSYDLYETTLWLTTETIHVVDDREGAGLYRLVNTDDKSAASATFLSW